MRKRKIGFPTGFSPENLSGFIMLSKQDLSKAIVSKLTTSQWKLWMYLMMIDSFADKTRDGERIYKDIPSPQQISILLGLNYYTVIKDIGKLRKLKLYDYRVTRWQGYNCSAQKAKEKSDDFKKHSKNTTPPQNIPHNTKSSLNNLKEEKIEPETCTGYGFCLFSQSGCLFSQSHCLFSQHGGKIEGETFAGYGFCLFNQSSWLFSQSGCLFNQSGWLFSQSGCLNNQSGWLFNPKLFSETAQSKDFSVSQTIQTNQTFSDLSDLSDQETRRKDERKTKIENKTTINKTANESDDEDSEIYKALENQDFVNFMYEQNPTIRNMKQYLKHTPTNSNKSNFHLYYSLFLSKQHKTIEKATIDEQEWLEVRTIDPHWLTFPLKDKWLTIAQEQNSPHDFIELCEKSYSRHLKIAFLRAMKELGIYQTNQYF